MDHDIVEVAVGGEGSEEGRGPLDMCGSLPERTQRASQEQGEEGPPLQSWVLTHTLCKWKPICVPWKRLRPGGEEDQEEDPLCQFWASCLCFWWGQLSLPYLGFVEGFSLKNDGNLVHEPEGCSGQF